MSANTILSRVQLKIDSETNWNAHSSFVPLLGELIVYSPDSTHTYSRIKIGDGLTTVVNLPFIDASTVGGVDVNSISANSLQHTLTFGANNAYVFDGTEDVTVPVYTGTII